MTGPRLVACLERLLPLLEHSSELAHSGYVSAQQPIGDVSRCLWQFRRDDYSRLFHLGLLMGADGPISTLAAANGWQEPFNALRADFAECFATLNRIRYARTVTAVELGDQVAVRGLLRRVPGRVAYVPGISPARPAIDFGGLFRVGVGLPGGRFTAVHVDPDSLELRHTVTFVRRDASDVPSPPTDEEIER